MPSAPPTAANLILLAETNTEQLKRKWSHEGAKFSGAGPKVTGKMGQKTKRTSQFKSSSKELNVISKLFNNWNSENSCFHKICVYFFFTTTRRPFRHDYFLRPLLSYLVVSTTSWPPCFYLHFALDCTIWIRYHRCRRTHTFKVLRCPNHTYKIGPDEWV